MNIAPYDNVLDCLRRAGRRVADHGEKAEAQCPAHDDHTPSLSIKRGDEGRALVHCHAGCTVEAVVKALGLELRDLMPPDPRDRGPRPGGGARVPRPKPTPTKPGRVYATFTEAQTAAAASAGIPVKSWDYHDAGGNVVMRVARFQPAEGAKQYRPFHPVAGASGGGGWACGDPPGPLPLYCLPDLAAAERVYVCEGEKAADAARSIGLAATCSAHGANSAHKSDWRPLAGREVVILRDNDAAGEGYARAVARLLLQLDRTTIVRIVNLPGLPEHGDIADWLDERDADEDTDGLRREVEEIAANVRPVAAFELLGPLKTVCLADVKPERVDWLWPGRFALGKVSMVAGRPGLGKSFLTMDMAARVTRGDGWPDAPTAKRSPGMVILLAHEDGLEDTIRPRLDAAGADVNRVYAIHGTPRGRDDVEMFNFHTDLDQLREQLRAADNPQLVIIDPITAYLGEIDGNNNSAVRGVLTPLADLAAEFHTCILLVQHLNKAQGQPALDRISGSTAFAGVARAVFMVIDDSADRERRLMLPAKNNLAKDSTGMAYRLIHHEGSDAPCIDWEPQPVTMTADDAVSADTGGGKLEAAMDWLAEQLSGGAVPQKDLEREARENDISVGTLRRAKAALGVESKREGMGPGSRVSWSLPHTCADESIDAQPHGCAPMGEAAQV